MLVEIIVTIVLSAIMTMLGDYKLQDNGINLGCGGLIFAFLCMCCVFFIPICTAVNHISTVLG